MPRPSWTVLAGGGAAVVAVVAAIVVTTGDGDSDFGGGCLQGLVAHLPGDVRTVGGSDFDRARAAGLDVDGDVGDLSEVVVATGLRLDPVTAQRVSSFDANSSDAGFTGGEMRCWLGDVSPSFVARGSFDADAIAGSDIGADGNAEVAGDLLAFDSDGEPEALLDPQEDGLADREPLVAAMAQLERQGVVSFDLLSLGDDADATSVGMGLAHGDDWELLGVWSFADDTQAGEQRDAVVEAIGQGAIGDMVDGDPDDLVQQHGSTLWLRAPITGDAADWTRPIAILDPALTIGEDLFDDD